jgi:hypothetical protein
MTPDPVRVRCALGLAAGGRVTPTAVARPGDDLLVLLAIDSSTRLARPLPVEVAVWRGGQIRDRWQRVIAGPATFAWRLPWRDRPAAGTRIAVRVTLDGHRVAESAVLLLPAPADAQGRFSPAAPPAIPSDAILLAVADQFRRLLDGDET